MGNLRSNNGRKDGGAFGTRADGADCRGHKDLRRPGHAVPQHNQPLAHLSESGPINASNPCSEYMFIDDSACNLASLNLMKFRKEDGSFDVDGFKKAVRLFIIAQEILVDNGSYPDKSIAVNSHLFRPLGLGYANLGSLIMSLALPYDSDQARALASAVSAIMTGAAYTASAEIASIKGPFEEFGKNARGDAEGYKYAPPARSAIFRNLIVRIIFVTPPRMPGMRPLTPAPKWASAMLR